MASQLASAWMKRRLSVARRITCRCLDWMLQSSSGQKMTTGVTVFSPSISKLFSELKLAIDNLLFIILLELLFRSKCYMQWRLSICLCHIPGNETPVWVHDSIIRVSYRFGREGAGIPPPPRNLEIGYGYYCGAINLILCVIQMLFGSIVSEAIWEDLNSKFSGGGEWACPQTPYHPATILSPPSNSKSCMKPCMIMLNLFVLHSVWFICFQLLLGPTSACGGHWSGDTETSDSEGIWPLCRQRSKQ